MRWMIITDEYCGIKKRAVNMLAGELGAQLDYVLPVKAEADVSDSDINNNHIIVIGEGGKMFDALLLRGALTLPRGKEAYSVYAGKEGEKQIIAVLGGGERGVLYGCMDLLNRFFGERLSRLGITIRDFLNTPTDFDGVEWQKSSCPAIETRAIWSWGHVIYDYRGFFDNMARLRLNEAVIWNDRLPLNAEDIVNYAHSLGIKVIWGFAWGWTTSCEEYASRLGDDGLSRIKESVLELYEREYANAPGDGIYFQSFTELKKESVGELSIADTVTRLVNETAGELLSRHPGLHIQFGLHASSVKEKLDIIAKVDKRLYIVWEDTGAFPYSYESSDTEGFDECLSLTKKLCTLRGKGELFGAVIKGMPNLDWTKFEHFTERYVMGEMPRSFIEARHKEKLARWHELTEGWLKNAELAAKTIREISHTRSSIVEMLVEDALFEHQIMLPTALMAELLWTPDKGTDELIDELVHFPIVYKF